MSDSLVQKHAMKTKRPGFWQHWLKHINFSVFRIRDILVLVLRIRDVYPGSRILIFTHPGSRIQNQQVKRGVKFHKIENYFKNTGLGSGIRDPGSEKTHSGSRKQGSKKAPDPGSGSATLIGTNPDSEPQIRTFD